MKQYRLYSKYKTQTAFKPVDWRQGEQVDKLIHATLFNETDKQAVQKDLDSGLNEGFTFEWREVKS